MTSVCKACSQIPCIGHSPMPPQAVLTCPWCWNVRHSCPFERNEFVPTRFEIHKGSSVLASKVIWRISVTHTTKERLCPSVINHDAQAAQRRFWSRNLQVLIKKERALWEMKFADCCKWSSNWKKNKQHTHTYRI